MHEMDYEELIVVISGFLMEKGLFSEFIDKLREKGYNPTREGFFDEDEDEGLFNEEEE